MENIYDNDRIAFQKRLKAFSATSLALGILGIITCLFPIIGFPVSITGLILGILGVKSSRQGMALTGITLCIAAIVLNGIISYLGIYILSEMYGHLNL